MNNITAFELAAIVVGAVGFIQGLIVLGDRIWGKKKDTSKAPDALAELVRLLRESPPQSIACAKEHSTISEVMKENTLALRQLCEVITKQTHAAEMQNQLLLTKLEILDRKKL